MPPPVRLYGGADSFRRTIASALAPAARAGRDASFELARSALDHDAFAAAWAGGQVLSPGQVVNEAAALVAASSPETQLTRSTARDSFGLTPREREVAG